MRNHDDIVGMSVPHQLLQHRQKLDSPAGPACAPVRVDELELATRTPGDLPCQVLDE